jgi:hypothetical protein
MYHEVLLKKQKQDLEEKTKFIQSIPFFQNWTVLTLSKFSYFFKEEEFSRNQFVFKMGDDLDSIYVVRKGDFEV